MTRMQVIAKAALMSLGIMAIASSAYALPLGGTRAASAALQTLVSLTYLFVQGGILYVLVIDNTSLANRLAPAAEGEAPASAPWRDAAMRSAMILCGLLLLMGTGKYLLRAMAFVVLPTGLRQFFQDMISMGILPALDTWGDIQAQVAVWYSLQALAAIYLICGAPHLVRWQARQSLRRAPSHTSSGEVS